MAKSKTCKYCGKNLERKRHGKRLENLRDFNKRQYCDTSCSAKDRKRGQSPIKETLKEATQLAASKDPAEYKTGVEILREIANTSKDETTRLNAAKALAPYETKKVDSLTGKEEKAERAKKAASGRFAPRPAPPLAAFKKQSR